MRDEHLGKRQLVMEGENDCPLLQPHDFAFRHCRRSGHAPRLTGQATLTTEFIRPEDCDDGFLPLLGNNRDLDLALLDVEDGICRIALCEDDPIFAKLALASSLAHFGKKYFRIK